MSRSITFINTTKKYGACTVIPDLSLEIEPGEFFTLLGPSGCGKTTLLRMVAGFVSIEEGSIYFDDTLINDVQPKNRNIGMVFQDYALFPNLTVGENIAFGLKNRKLHRTTIKERVHEILAVVQMTDHRDKLPEKLSGGQQQRVALARAIVFHPDVLLMDEPLSNLDAKLRVDMRNVIKDLQKKVGITTIYVTHDQEEAMAISDRIGIMNSGILQQIGTPREIYQRPNNLFVASFIGQTNVLEGVILFHQGYPVLEFVDLYRERMDSLTLPHGVVEEIPVKISVRPEEFTVNEKSEGICAHIEDRMFLGLNTHYVARLKTGGQVKLIRESTVLDPLIPGTEITLGVKKEKINVYHQKTGVNLNNEFEEMEVVKDA